MKDIWTRLYTFFVLSKLRIKKRFLSISRSQIFISKRYFMLNELWDHSVFPNYEGKTISKTPTQSSRVNGFVHTHIDKQTFYDTSSSSSFFRFGNMLLSSWDRATRFWSWALNSFRRSIGDGFIYLRGLFILFFFDAMLTDDEPLWEPIEWSLVQSWIMLIFAFAWIGENLISSRYGSYTGRDKRVWFSWYKTFWLIEGWYVLTMGAAALFVMVPFYHEISYTLPLVVSWWNWYSRVFFFKFIASYSLVLYLAYYLQLTLGSVHWRKSLFLILIINIFLSYLLYTHFLMGFFAYFTDPNWYSKTRLVDYIHLSHEPNKWSWGNSKRDHFSYHKSTTVFWFKNDGPFAAAFLFFHILFFLCLFALYLYWLTLFRRVYATQEITYTYTTYCVSALRQFFYYFLLLYLLVFFSFILQYWRLPIEYGWVANTKPILYTLASVLHDYPSFLVTLFNI